MNTREKIVKSAIEAFWKEGFQRITIQNIASKVGITQPGVYMHFESKSDILREACAYAAEQGRQFIDRSIGVDQPAKLSFRSYIEGNINWVLKYRSNANCLMAMYYFGIQEKSLKALHVEIDKKGIERISHYIFRGNHEKVWKVLNPQTAARAIHSYLVGEMIKALHFPEEFSLSNRIATIQKNCEKLLV